MASVGMVDAAGAGAETISIQMWLATIQRHTKAHTRTSYQIWVVRITIISDLHG